MAAVLAQEMIDMLVTLGYDRELCIQASKMVTNCNDINELQDKIVEIKNQQSQQQYAMDEQKQLDPYKVWQCGECYTRNILYNSICKQCNNINHKMESNIKNMIKIMLPTWSHISNDQIKLEKIKNALSSKIYIVSNTKTRFSKFIFRIYNPNTINKSHSEIQYLFSNKLKIGPKLICKMGDFGQMEEYLDSRQSERIKDLYQNEIIYKKVAQYLAKIHSSTVISADETKPILSDGWVKQLLTAQSNKLKDVHNHQKCKWFMDIIEIYYAKDNNRKVDFVDIEMEWLLSMNKKYTNDLCYRLLNNLDEEEKEEIFANTTDIVFCHHDLNHRNILLLNKNDGDDEKHNNNDDTVRIIDYEYCGYGHRFWDFGHYFCEIAINASLPPPKYFEINMKEEYPNLKYRKSFVKYYLDEVLRIKLNVKSLKSIAIIDEKYVDLFVNTIEIGSLWIHLTCVMWAFGEWQNVKGKEVAFDFKRYTEDRLHCFFQQKQRIQLKLE